MEITKDQFLAVLPQATHKVDIFLGPLNDAMAEFGIVSRLDTCAFLANVGHESGQFRWMEEIATGGAYEGRVDLGNTEPGDGRKFKGRGPLQTTGRANYARVSMELYGDDRLLHAPELLAQPVDGCRSSALFWKDHNISAMADSGDFDGVCDKVNRGHKTVALGDSNGWEERLAMYNIALDVIEE